MPVLSTKCNMSDCVTGEVPLIFRGCCKKRRSIELHNLSSGPSPKLARPHARGVDLLDGRARPDVVRVRVGHEPSEVPDVDGAVGPVGVGFAEAWPASPDLGAVGVVVEPASGPAPVAGRAAREAAAVRRLGLLQAARYCCRASGLSLSVRTIPRCISTHRQ